MRRQVAADAGERDAVDVVLEAERLPRLLVVLPLRVPHGESGRLLVPLLDDVRAGRDEALVDLGVERVARRHGREERHRDARDEVGRNPLQVDDQRAGVRRRHARDVVEERRRRRLQLRVLRPVERPLEARGRHRLTVRELEALLDRDRVPLAVVRDSRHALRRHRRDPLARGPGDVRIPVHAQLRRTHPVPRVREVGERRIEVIEVTGVQDPERASLLRCRLARRRRPRGATRRRSGDEQAGSHDGHHGRKPDTSLHVAPFGVSAGPGAGSALAPLAIDARERSWLGLG